MSYIYTFLSNQTKYSDIRSGIKHDFIRPAYSILFSSCHILHLYNITKDRKQYIRHGSNIYLVRNNLDIKDNKNWILILFHT